jgi:hypothetical protein
MTFERDCRGDVADPELGRSASGTDAKSLAKNENLLCGFRATGCLIR